LKYDRNYQLGSNCKNTPNSILPLWRYELLLIPASVSENFFSFLKKLFLKLDCLFPSIPLKKLHYSRSGQEIFLYVDPPTRKLTILGYYCITVAAGERCSYFNLLRSACSQEFCAGDMMI
jgi:hypothetical protein